MYQTINSYLVQLPAFQEWVQPKTILERFSSSLPRDWILPLVACDAVYGSKQPGIPASAALACVQLSILLVDDMLDEDPRGEYQKIGAGQAANLASAFLS